MTGQTAVYTWARQQSFGQVVPVGSGWWQLRPSKSILPILKLDRPTDEELASGSGHPPGTIHLPSWIESEWVKQLVGEQLVTVRNKRGFARLEWQKLRERKEALDCRVYARAAAWIAGADRMAPNAWSGLQQRVNPAAKVQKPEQPQAPQPPNKPAQHVQARRPNPFKGRQSNWMTSGKSWFRPGR